MRRLLMPVEKRFMVHGTWYGLEETFSTWTIILSYKCFSSTFERSLFHDPLNTLALEGLSSATHAQPELELKLQKRAYPTTNLKSERTLIPTNFYADERIRGVPQIEMKNELRRARMSSSTNYYAGGTNTRLHRRRFSMPVKYMYPWYQCMRMFSVYVAIWKFEFGVTCRRSKRRELPSPPTRKRPAENYCRLNRTMDADFPGP